MVKLGGGDGAKNLGYLTTSGQEVTWEAVKESLTCHRETPNKNEAPFFVGGYFNPDGEKTKHGHVKRVDHNLVARTMVVLDMDHCPLPNEEAKTRLIKSLQWMKAVGYTTYSATPEKAKWRICIMVDRDMDHVEFEAVSRKLAEDINIEWMDVKSFVYNQLMFLPSCPVGGFKDSFISEGMPTSVDDTLRRYANFADPDQWCYASHDKNRSHSKTSTAKTDPKKRKGLPGAFNTKYNVITAIEHFDLPYAECGDGRYKRTDVSNDNKSSAVVFDTFGEGSFIYQHSSKDPAIYGEGAVSAYDLVRLVLHGELDEGSDAPYFALPSHKAMEKLAMECGVQHEGVDIHEILDAEEFPYDLEARTRLAEVFATLRLTPIQEDEVWATIKERTTGFTKDAWKRQLRMVKQQSENREEGEDAEFVILNRVLDAYFAGGAHLRRFGTRWWAYSGGVWSVMPDEELKGKIVAVLRSLRTDSFRELPVAVEDILAQNISALYPKLAGVMAAHIAEKYASTDPLRLREDPRPIINCLNGQLEFEPNGSFELKPHNPEDFLTHQIPVNYNPDAECPRWDTLCSDIMFYNSDDPEDNQRHLEEVCGYIIQPSRKLFRAWGFMRGNTGAGKSTLGQVLSALLQSGVTSVANLSSTYDGRNTHATAGLIGKLLLLQDDTSKQAKLPEGFLKIVSESKHLQANPKSKDEFDFICYTFPLLMSNHWPNMQTVDDATLDRILVWDLTYTCPRDKRSDQEVEKLLTEDLEGVLARFVRGYSRLRARREWRLPDDCVKAKEVWSQNANSINQFLAEGTYYDPSNFKDGIGLSELHQEYVWWMHQTNNGTPEGRTAFKEQVSMKYVYGRDSTHRFFKGLFLQKGENND